MKIAIVTLPLHTNYGGLLQAYALKTALESMGHEAKVLDRKVKMPLPPCLKAPFIYAKRALKGVEVFRERRYRKEYPVVSENTSRFIDKYIDPRIIGDYKELREDEYDALIVGSDQVWRPLYFGKIEDAYLAFAKDWDIIRVAYAASFGTDKLEYEYFQLEECARLLEAFNGVSVREDVGVQMCSEWFDCEKAVQVLDPVMLLDRKVYETMASSVESRSARGKIATYILDQSPEKCAAVEFMSKTSGFEVCDLSVKPNDKSIPLAERVVPPVENWLAGFIDADFVITDSFHGCVLSILFHKRFMAVGNSRRGMSRIQSLLGMFGLDMRLVHGIDPEDDGEYFMSEPDWAAVDAVLENERAKSLAFLKDSLAKS